MSTSLESDKHPRSLLCVGSTGEVLSLLKSLQESQLEIKEVVTVFSAAALDLWAACSTTNTERDLFRIELIQ